MWELVEPIGLIEVTRFMGGRKVREDVPLRTAGSTGPLKRIKVRSSASVVGGDLTTRWGIPVTTPARTLLDLASVLTATQLGEAVESAFRADRLDAPEVEFLLRRTSGRKEGEQLRRSLGSAFELDRERTSNLEAAGFRVLRLTWRMVTAEPRKTLDKTRSYLALAKRGR